MSMFTFMFISPVTRSGAITTATAVTTASTDIQHQLRKAPAPSKPLKPPEPNHLRCRTTGTPPPKRFSKKLEKPPPPPPKLAEVETFEWISTSCTRASGTGCSIIALRNLRMHPSILPLFAILVGIQHAYPGRKSPHTPRSAPGT